MKSMIFETYPDDIAEGYYDTIDALKDLEKQYKHFTFTVWKASKQLLKFDEINRLVATEVEEKAASVKASSGRGSSSSKSSSTTKAGSAAGKTKTQPVIDYDPHRYDAQLPLYFAIKDVLFEWGDLNWEQIMMKLLAGFTALGGAVIGGMVGGVPGAVIGLTAGLAFGILMDSIVFNFDGELSSKEIQQSVIAALPAVAGGVLGFVAGGPAGAAIGILLGATLSFRLLGTDWSEIINNLREFFKDLSDNFTLRWYSFLSLVHGLWDGLKRWWSGLILDRFTFRLPHLTVQWQELASNSILSRYLGITAIPHLGVEWYARGGIVDGATLIGVGEQGKEAIVPLEKHTEWIHMVAVQLKEELAKLTPAAPQTLRLIPAAASSLVPYAATVRTEAPQQLNLDGLADTIARAISALGDREDPEPVIRVYLDGKQLSDAVTKYQRRSARSTGA